ncbi:alanine racemase [Bacillus solimangrovi]|uniref:Alanine racemase n=1 Tax=Bacillus solimangrovi TaxID=1305675 RepID=A0A1E5LJX7_9BACI|nr:alanine racemase [Bacillus solimangrovi]OEH94328.1 alanine racemase [Bacillus solimangrovi]
MKHASYRDTWVSISLDAIKNNIQQFRNHISSSCKFMAVVKADGYGHGAEIIAKTAIKEGADYLGVAFIDEAVQLRKCGITTPILVLGYTPPDTLQLAIEQNITLTCFSEDILVEASKIATNLNKTALIHLKVDTGMSRIGVRTKEDALSFTNRAASLPNVVLEGIFTHFAAADSNDSTFTDMQFSTFQEIVDYVERSGFHFQLKHCCNSAGTMQYPHMHLDMVRVGISLYGLLPDPNIPTRPFELKQAMQFKTKIVTVKDLEEGNSISYGCTYTTESTRTIATLPIGYADGLNRLLSNKAEMIVRGKRAPIVGRICMDQTMIDVTGIPNVQHHDEVTIFGRDQNCFISIDEIAQLIGTINYEIVCAIGKRVPRIYYEGDNIVDSQNLFFNQH